MKLVHLLPLGNPCRLEGESVLHYTHSGFLFSQLIAVLQNLPESLNKKKEQPKEGVTNGIYRKFHV